MGRVGFVFGFGLRARLFVPFLVPSKKKCKYIYLDGLYG